MKDWQAQQMWEDDAAKQWEKENAADPLEKELKKASKTLKDVIRHMDKATDSVADALRLLTGTPLEDQIRSYVNDLEDITSDIARIQENFAKGWRE